MCSEWPGWACLVSQRCLCLCSTTYGQLVKSSSHHRPMGPRVWSRSVWISDNTVLPLPQLIHCPLMHMSGPNYYMSILLIVMICFIPSISNFILFPSICCFLGGNIREAFSLLGVKISLGFHVKCVVKAAFHNMKLLYNAVQSKKTSGSPL